MNTGFTVRCCDGKVDYLPIGASGRRDRSLVSVAWNAEAQAGAALIGRLDYRDELVAALPGQSQLSGLSDAALALAVYLHSSRAGLERLEGEFSLVVWNTRNGCLTGMRDPFGAWPLFWTVRGPVLLMGTSLRSLAESGSSQSLDPAYVAEYLVSPFLDAEITSERTAIRGVQRVLPGTIQELTTISGSRQHRYWDWRSRIRPVAVTNAAEAAERFRGLLDHAVRERMRDGPVASHLSGGMDSSSVAILARRNVAETLDRRPVQAISLIYHVAELASERGYMDLVLAQGGPMQPHFVRSDQALGFDWFRQPLPDHDEPYAGLWSLAANRLLADTAARCDVSTVLTGVGADEILSYRPLHIADLFRRGRAIAGLREASVWAESRGQGLWSVLRKCAIEPMWPAERRSVPPWIRPEFVREQRLRNRCDDFASRMFASPAEHSQTLMRLAMSTGDWARWYLHAPLGINISHPFQDPRVICYTLGLRRNLRTAPGEAKPLLREAMRGLLPDPIANRREKTGFDGPHARGLDAHLPRLEQLVRNSSVIDLGVFDPDKLVTAMRQVAIGIDSRQNVWIDRVLALVGWMDIRTRRSAKDSQVPVPAADVTMAACSR
jgi:asparagine synthase (glutamine-hydrolysing)